jgi:hypothetical protein
VGAVALAMSVIDPSRAFEIVEDIKDANVRLDVGLQVAFYVVQNQKTRNTLSFDQWNNTGSWKDGKPSPW